jgi:PleD family two-component response regulator
LVELYLPDRSGLDTFAQFLRAAPQIPLLILTDAQHEVLARLAVRQGAHDYLIKETRAAKDVLLPKMLRTVIDRLNAVAEKMTGWTRGEAAGHKIEEVFGTVGAATGEQVRKVMELAIHDQVTACLAPNHTEIHGEAFEVAFEDSAAPIHLQSVVGRLLGCVRRSDTVSRQDGDEFVILLSEINQAQDAAVSAEKMLQALDAPHRIDQHELRVTGSIGIVIYPDDGTEAEVLLKHGDFAMYHAKHQGRNNYQFFEPNLNVRALERQVLESGLRRAIGSQELL